MGQADRSLFHCQSLLLWVSSMMYFSFLATCRAESCNLLWLSGSQLSFPFGATPGEKSTSKTQSTAVPHQPRYIWVPSQRGKREFLSVPPPCQWWPKSASLQPELSWHSCPSKEQTVPALGCSVPEESLRLEMGHAGVPLMPLVWDVYLFWDWESLWEDWLPCKR